MSKPLDFTFDLNHREADYLGQSDDIFLGFLGSGIQRNFTIPTTRSKWAVRFVFEPLSVGEMMVFISSVPGAGPVTPVFNSIVSTDFELCDKVCLKKYNGGDVVIVQSLSTTQMYFTAACYTLDSNTLT